MSLEALPLPSRTRPLPGETAPLRALGQFPNLPEMGQKPKLTLETGQVMDDGQPQILLHVPSSGKAEVRHKAAKFLPLPQAAGTSPKLIMRGGGSLVGTLIAPGPSPIKPW